MKMIEKLNAAVLSTLESATIDAEIKIREKRYTIYRIVIDHTIPIEFEMKNTTGRKRTEKQALTDWKENKLSLYATYLEEYRSKKLQYTLDESYAKHGYRMPHRSNLISCEIVKSGLIIFVHHFSIPQEWFVGCEDYMQGSVLA